MATLPYDAIAAQVRRAIRLTGYTAIVRIPQAGQDTVGQPVNTFTEHPDIPAYLASTPHPSEQATGRVEEDTDWRWLYIPDDAGVDLQSGYEVEVLDSDGTNLGVFKVTGDVVKRPGHYRARVRVKR